MADDASSKTEGEKLYDDKTAKSFEGKALSQYMDPCQEAAERSIRCLRRNAGDREMCTDYFQAYRDCKQQWMEKMREEKRAQRRGGWW